MVDLRSMTPPAHLDWQAWVERWDRMQERYLVRRTERFDIIARLLHAIPQGVTKVLDLGCGTGSLALAVLDALPEAAVLGVDFDPTMLWLARARLERFGPRVQIKLLDVRDPSWGDLIEAPVDAVVSATAMHWLSPTQLAEAYRTIAQILKPGGIFLNADHVASDSPEIQRAWESHREEMRREEGTNAGDDWDGFWTAYAVALGLDIGEIHQAIGEWAGGQGVEEGLPLAWHLDTLRAHGFVHTDCFWRCDCDAIYGGIRT